MHPLLFACNGGGGGEGDERRGFWNQLAQPLQHSYSIASLTSEFSNKLSGIFQRFHSSLTEDHLAVAIPLFVVTNSFVLAMQLIINPPLLALVRCNVTTSMIKVLSSPRLTT